MGNIFGCMGSEDKLPTVTVRVRAKTKCCNTNKFILNVRSENIPDLLHTLSKYAESTKKQNPS